MPDQATLRYPIGPFQWTESITSATWVEWLSILYNFPAEIAELTKDLSDEQLAATYREGSWSVQDLVHHCGDSHTHGFFRCKWALTDHNYTVKPYLEARWAERADYELPVMFSLVILGGIHTRWVALLSALSLEERAILITHPEYERRIRLEQYLGVYVWHSQHHLAHIRLALGIDQKKL